MAGLKTSLYLIHLYAEKSRGVFLSGAHPESPSCADLEALAQAVWI